MKKVFYSICAAVLVMACAKTDPVFEPSGEISFSPVSKYATKSAVTGTNFTADQNFYVFANTAETESAKYFENILFVPDGANKTDVGQLQVYKGSPAQYWPNVTPLKFAGYTVSGNVGDATDKVLASMSQWGTMSLNGYVQNPTATANNDLMWFVDNGTDGAGYTKATKYVTPVMKHALSWLTVQVKVDEKLLDTDENTDGAQPYWTNINIYSIKLETLNTKGNVTLAGAALWENPTTPITNVVIYDDSNGKPLNGTATTFENTENNTIVIPQIPVTLAVQYGYTTPAGGTVRETITDISLEYDGDDTKETAWEPGKHYTYVLTIGAEEIKIAPSSEDWVPYDASAEEGIQNPSQTI